MGESGTAVESIITMFKEAVDTLGVTKRETALVFLFLLFSAMCGYAWRWALHRIRDTISIGEELRVELSKQLLNSHAIIEAQHAYITKLREVNEEQRVTIEELRTRLDLYE